MLGYKDFMSVYKAAGFKQAIKHFSGARKKTKINTLFLD